MNKTALAISAVLTAFVLVIVGGLAYATTVSAKQAELQAAEPLPVVENTAGLDIQTQQTILEREAAYRSLIEQANSQLAELQQQNQQLLDQIQAGSATEPEQLQGVAPEVAAQIASQAYNQSQVFSVETKDWNGVMVYQVTFSSGDVATLGMDGQILAFWQAPRSQTVYVGGHDQGGYDDDHDDHEDDD